MRSPDRCPWAVPVFGQLDAARSHGLPSRAEERDM